MRHWGNGTPSCGTFYYRQEDIMPGGMFLYHVFYKYLSGFRCSPLVEIINLIHLI